ncbi:type ISP restriction/modification enzyme [Streptomyces sp. NPDC047860]|uniref:type ISP restriction/modification enzyme n=1 Tax=Streptomyces sp. NPDC047860 TaxID=3155743 RepID=UPI0033CFE9E1
MLVAAVSREAEGVQQRLTLPLRAPLDPAAPALGLLAVGRVPDDGVDGHAAGRAPGSITYAPGDPRQVRYLAPICSEVPHEMRYEAATQTLHLGAGSSGPVPEDVWAYDVGAMGILKKWFGYRKARPDSRRSSPLDDIHARQWPSEWSTELIELLTVLRRLVELAPAQGALLERILAAPLITEEVLKAAGGVLPVADKARKPRRSVTFDNFETTGDADHQGGTAEE